VSLLSAVRVGRVGENVAGFFKLDENGTERTRRHLVTKALFQTFLARQLPLWKWKRVSLKMKDFMHKERRRGGEEERRRGGEEEGFRGWCNVRVVGWV
jgi:hypothetical protein